MQAAGCIDLQIFGPKFGDALNACFPPRFTCACPWPSDTSAVPTTFVPTPEQLGELQFMFKMYDTNDDGGLDLKVRTGLCHPGWDGPLDGMWQAVA